MLPTQPQLWKAAYPLTLTLQIYGLTADERVRAGTHLTLEGGFVTLEAGDVLFAVRRCLARARPSPEACLESVARDLGPNFAVALAFVAGDHDPGATVLKLRDAHLSHPEPPPDPPRQGCTGEATGLSG